MVYLFKWDQDTVSAKVYDELIVRLEEAGAGSPPGRLYHVCYGRPDQPTVVDVWDSTRHFQEFGETLMPTLVELGGKLLEPDVWPVYNIIKPQRAAIQTPGCLLVRFDPPGMHSGQYDKIMKCLGEGGYGEPPERLYHVCYREDFDLRIISVWQSAQALRVFFDQAVHIALDLRIPEVPLTELVVEEVHCIIDGSPLLSPPSSCRQSD